MPDAVDRETSSWTCSDCRGVDVPQQARHPLVSWRLVTTAASSQTSSIGESRLARGVLRELSPRILTAGTLAFVFVFDLFLLVHRAFSADISPFDEGYHLSYVQYMHEWSLPRVGDPMGSWSEQMYACHPTYPFGQVTAIPCGVDGPSIDYPEGGRNTAAGWPPMYYFMVALIMRPLLALGLEPFLAGRTSSALLWAVGCLVLAGVVIRVSGSRVLAASAGILGSTIPATWPLSSFVTPHSTAMLIGVSLLMLLIWAASTERPIWFVVLVAGALGAVIELTLPHAIVAIAAACMAAVVLAWSLGRQRGRLSSMAIALAASGAATYLSWERLVLARSSGSGPDQPAMPPEGWVAAVRDNWNLFWPRGLAEVQFLSGREAQFAVLISYASVALAGHWLLSSEATVQRGVAVGVVMATPVLASFVAYRFDFVLPTRYGASVFALLLFLLALNKPSLIVRGVVLGLTAASAWLALASINSYLVLNPAT